MNRRSFLRLLGALGLAQGVLGCRQSLAAALQVHLLSRTLPSQLVGQFRRQIKSQPNPVALSLTLKSSTADLFQELQGWAQGQPSTEPNGSQSSEDPSVYRLSSGGDYWLAAAIQQNLLQPWPPGEIQNWSSVPPNLQAIARRDRQGQMVSNGEIWGIPYRWGATVIAFRKDKFRKLGWQPTDWADLWRPELAGNISLLDQPREVIGLTLKQLQQSYNTVDLTRVAELPAKLKALHQQVKFYSSTDYLQPLLLGDTWAAVGWSTDILRLMEQEPDIQAIAPASGTALWTDLWLRPQTNPPELGPLKDWAEFWLQTEVANALSKFSDALSPVLSAFQPDSPVKALLRPDQPWYAKSEFLEPLPASTLAQYSQFWQQMRV